MSEKRTTLPKQARAIQALLIKKYIFWDDEQWIKKNHWKTGSYTIILMLHLKLLVGWSPSSTWLSPSPSRYVWIICYVWLCITSQGGKTVSHNPQSLVCYFEKLNFRTRILHSKILQTKKWLFSSATWVAFLHDLILSSWAVSIMQIKTMYSCNVTHRIQRELSLFFSETMCFWWWNCKSFLWSCELTNWYGQDRNAQGVSGGRC